MEASAARSVPATEARLLSVPRPSLRGLRATSAEPTPVVQLVKPLAAAKRSAPANQSPAPAMKPPAPAIKPPTAAEALAGRACRGQRQRRPLAATLAALATADEEAPHPPQPLAALPSLPTQAPALPERAPSGDTAADAVELLLARVVDPFGASEEEP